MRWVLVALALASCAPTPAAHVSAPVAVAPSPVHVAPSVASRSRPLVTRGERLSVTCYTATGHRTASGVWPRVGMAAGNRWPLGTRLRVERVGVVVVTDRIGHGSDLDLFRTSRSACVRFGRQALRVSVVR